MKGEARREQVLACATRVFAERGYHRTTVHDIVTRAGVARGTFYLYFGDKRSIFDELVDGFILDLRKRIVRLDPSVEVEEGLRVIRKNVEGVVEVMLAQRDLTKILLSDAVGLDDDFDRKLLAFYAELSRILERSLRQGQEIGIVRPCDVQVAAIFIIGALKELMYQVTLAGYEPEPQHIVEEFLTHIREGILVFGRAMSTKE